MPHIHRLHVVIAVACALVGTRLRAEPVGQDAVAQQTNQTTSTSDSASGAEQLEVLIEQLAAPNFRARESAHQRLQALGLPAFERLRDTAANHPNPEIARAARYLLGSQQVNWALETDSLQVRDLLKNYNEQPADERATRHDSLAKLATPDAFLALGRLARFEASEDLSRAAAISLLEALEKLRDPAVNSYRLDANSVYVRIRESVESSDRVACMWIAHATQDGLAFTAGNSDFTSEETWDKLAAEQVEYAKDREPATKLLGLRYFEWLGKWTTETLGRESAIELARGILNLLGEDRRRIESTARVLLDHQLPELLVEIAENMDELFDNSPRLSFLRAEAFLQLGDTDKANALAEETSEKIGETLKKQLAALATQVNALVIEVARRRDHAAILYQRGMFRWSEREFQKIIQLEQKQRQALAKEGLTNLETISDQEIDIRSLLATLYWEAGENAKAADVLRPVHEYFNSDDFEPTIVRYISPGEISAYYHFYTGLAHRDASENNEACAAFLRAIATEDAQPNPDIVIAMRDVAIGTRYEDDYMTALLEMSGTFRNQLLNLEESLSSVQSRSQELAMESQIATECNQLAWLLAKCKHETKEALELSLRSVELKPTTPAYLDTLARCYYENGRLDDAIAAQQKACGLSPHDRQLSGQLEEFLRLRDEANEKAGRSR